jgi:hypothetical protein
MFESYEFSPDSQLVEQPPGEQGRLLHINDVIPDAI